METVIHSREVSVSTWAGTTQRLREISSDVDEAIASFRNDAVAQAQHYDMTDNMPRSVQSLLRVLIDEKVDAVSSMWQVQATVTNKFSGEVIAGPAQAVLTRTLPDSCAELRVSVPTSGQTGPFISLTFDRVSGVRLAVAGTDEAWTTTTADSLERALLVNRVKNRWVQSKWFSAVLSILILSVSVLAAQPPLLEVCRNYYQFLIPGQSPFSEVQQYRESVRVGFDKAAVLASWLLPMLLGLLVASSVYKLARHVFGDLVPAFEVLEEGAKSHMVRVLAAFIGAVATVMLGLLANTLYDLLTSRS